MARDIDWVIKFTNLLEKGDNTEIIGENMVDLRFRDPVIVMEYLKNSTRY